MGRGGGKEGKRPVRLGTIDVTCIKTGMWQKVGLNTLYGIYPGPFRSGLFVEQQIVSCVGLIQLHFLPH